MAESKDPRYVKIEVIKQELPLLTFAVSGTRKRGLGFKPVEDLIQKKFQTLWTLYDFKYKIQMIHGAADGVDSACAYFAKELGWEVKEEKANWIKYGNAAGMIRNELILDKWKPKFLLAFPGPDSIGTWGMIREATKRKINYEVCFYDR